MPLEYKVFTDYCSKLLDTIPARNVSHYFVSENVISLTDHEEIAKPTTSSHAAAQLLVNKILYKLKGQDSCDYSDKILSILEDHGDSAICTLSQEIKLEIYIFQQSIHCMHSACTIIVILIFV